MPLTARCVCSTCNNTWLSDLEALARPVISRMILGEGVRLSIDDQVLVGVWITKTAMLIEQIELLTVQQFFTDADRQQMLDRDFLEPPYRSAIWLGAYDGDSVSVTEICGLRHTVQQTGQITTGTAITFAIGALTGQMMCHRAGSGTNTPYVLSLPMQTGRWSRALIPIWPIQDEEVLWPPFYTFNDRNFSALGQRWHVPQPSPFELQQRVRAEMARSLSKGSM